MLLREESPGGVGLGSLGFKCLRDLLWSRIRCFTLEAQLDLSDWLPAALLLGVSCISFLNSGDSPGVWFATPSTGDNSQVKDTDLDTNGSQSSPSSSPLPAYLTCSEELSSSGSLLGTDGEPPFRVSPTGCEAMVSSSRVPVLVRIGMEFEAGTEDDAVSSLTMVSRSGPVLRSTNISGGSSGAMALVSTRSILTGPRYVSMSSNCFSSEERSLLHTEPNCSLMVSPRPLSCDGFLFLTSPRKSWLSRDDGGLTPSASTNCPIEFGGVSA